MPAADPSDLAPLLLFNSLSESELAEIAGWFEVREVGAGTRLVGEGTTGHAFFVICEGEAAVTADGEQIDTLGAGDFFGELAMLGAGRRMATVTTAVPSRVLVLFGADFARLRETYPGVAAALDATIEERRRR